MQSAHMINLLHVLPMLYLKLSMKNTSFFSNRYLSYDKAVQGFFFVLYIFFMIIKCVQYFFQAQHIPTIMMFGMLCVCALKIHSINKHKLLCESY